MIALYGTLQRIEAEAAPQDGPGGIYPDAVAGYLAYLNDPGRVPTGQRRPPRQLNEVPGRARPVG